MPAHARFQVRRALRALAALTRDPDDTAQAFTVIEALSGGAPERVTRRFAADPTGARLLRERPDLMSILSDRERLRALPEGSLGRAYLAFVESEGIDAAGLVEAAKQGEAMRWSDPEREFVHARMRDTHDLWHTVTGYRGDLLGEASILAFSIPQTCNPGLVLIVLAGVLRLHDVEATRLVADAIRRGARAAWLPPVAWEELLPRPLDEVRALLRIDPPPSYVPLRTSELRAMGMLEPRRAAA